MNGSAIAPNAPPEHIFAHRRVRVVADLIFLAGRRLVRWAVLVGVLMLTYAGGLQATITAKWSAGEDWTVVTVARDGSWGVANASSIGQAIAAAIRSCRAMAGTSSDCGAQFEATRNGWALANLCGDRKIIVAASNLADAEAAARRRETDLRRHHAPDLPPCRRVLTVEPGGVVARSSTRNSRLNPSEVHVE
jgi:hypothetical protein